MRNLFKSSMFIAVAAMAFAGCTKEDTGNVSEATGNKITVNANAYAPETETRTVIGDKTEQGTYPVYWSAENEALAIVEVADGKAADAVKTGEYTLSEGNKSANFQFELTKNTSASAFDYYACYPHSAYSNIYLNYKDVSVKLPAAQTPSATSADPNASILFAMSTGHNAQPSTLDFSFKHVAAYGKMTVTGLSIASSEVVKSVTFSTPDNGLAGAYWYYYETPETSQIGGTSYNSITANVEGLVSDGSQDFVVWFACLPTTVNTSFSVSVQTEANTYVRNITVPSDRALEFAAGQVSAFTVDMSSATSAEDYSGEYVILAEQSGSYYALSSTYENDTKQERLDAVTFEYNGTDESIVTDNSNIIWTVTKSGSSYNFANGGKFLSWDGRSNVALLTEAEYELTITKNSETTYTISPATDSGRKLAKNSSNPYFAFYSGSGTYNLLLVSAQQVVLPKIETDVTEISIEHNDNASHELNVTVSDATSVSAAAYDDAEGTAECSWLTAEYTEGKVTYMAETNDTEAPRTAYIVITATNENGSRKAVVSVSQAVNPSLVTSITATMDTFTSTSSNNIAGDYNVYYSCAKGGGTSDPAINDNVIRLYQNKSGKAGGNITISAAPGYKIESVTIGSDMNTFIKYEIDGNNIHLPDSAISLAAGATYTLSDQNANSVTFHCYGTTSSTRLYVNYLSVTYVKE